MNNEFIWTLKVDEEEHIFKCVVLENECVTYEDDVEHKHLKITNPVKKQNVLQIDTVTSVFGEQMPFQLENGVPYLQIDGKWKMSATSYAARQEKRIKDQKLIALLQLGIGAACCIACLIRYLIQSTMGSWFILLIIGSIMIVTGIAQYVDLRNVEKELKA